MFNKNNSTHAGCPHDSCFYDALKKKTQLTQWNGFSISKVSCRIHPSVIMTMLDSHGRLSDTAEFAIGTLLGHVTSDVGGTIIEVTDCFTNPYHWDAASSSLTIQKEPHDWMLKLKEKLNPKLGVVGWCCTTDVVLYTTSLSDWVRSEQKVSRLYASKTLCEPLHISINPKFDKSLSILDEVKVFIRGSLRQVFHPVRFTLIASPGSEKILSAVAQNSQAIESSPGSTHNQDPFQKKAPSILDALKTIQFYIKPCLLYIEKVLEGQVIPDESIGCRLMEAVSCHTLLSKDELNAKYIQEVQDALLVTYLKNLASLQFSIAEKLNAQQN